MSDLRKVLSNFVYRRRTFTKHSIIGKPSFIYGPTEQSVTEKEELLSIVKRDLEVYGLGGVRDTRALNILPTVPCKDEVVKDEDSDTEDESDMTIHPYG
jgi:hypothetical protein